MKNCTNCGNVVEDEAVFCDVCGSKVDDTQKLQEETTVIKIKEVKADDLKPIIYSQPVDSEAKRRKYWLIGSIGSVLVVVLLMTPILFNRISGVSDSNSVQSSVASQSGNTNTSTETSSSDTVSQTASSNSSTASKTGQDTKTPYNEMGIHRYDYVLSDGGWTEDFTKAKAMGGYLAHINSNEEFSYITRELENKGYQKMEFYIGGRRDSGSQNYHWVDGNNKPYGELLNSSMGSWFWLKNEPSFIDGSIEEAYLNILYYKAESKWVGNDGPENIVACLPEFSGKTGFIVEYDE